MDDARASQGWHRSGADTADGGDGGDGAQQLADRLRLARNRSRAARVSLLGSTTRCHPLLTTTRSLGQPVPSYICLHR